MADRMQGTHQSAVIPSATPVVVAMTGAPLPCTITLKSAGVGRKIELSTDGGVEYFTASPDTATTTMQVLTVIAPISHIRLTGTTNDTWSIR
jgi:hypothetical protein